MWKSTRRAPALATAGALLSLGTLLGLPAWADSNDAAANAGAADQPATEAAIWTPKQVEFTYMGFTAHYTCDGLRDDVREMLLQLGARRDDLKVTEICAGDPNRPNPFPGVRIKMSVLTTPVPASLPPGTQIVPAQWKTVKLPNRASPLDAAGQCELLEQFKQKILPLFTSRNVDFRATCVPHQLDPLGVHLQAEVLKTNQKREASAAEAR